MAWYLASYISSYYVQFAKEANILIPNDYFANVNLIFPHGKEKKDRMVAVTQLRMSFTYEKRIHRSMESPQGNFSQLLS